MTYAKYVLIKVNKNLLRLVVSTIYVKNVLENYLRRIKFIIALYVDNKIGAFIVIFVFFLMIVTTICEFDFNLIFIEKINAVMRLKLIKYNKIVSYH